MTVMMWLSPSIGRQLRQAMAASAVHARLGTLGVLTAGRRRNHSPQPLQLYPIFQAREDKAGGTSNLLYYAPLESILQHDGKYVSKASTTVWWAYMPAVCRQGFLDTLVMVSHTVAAGLAAHAEGLTVNTNLPHGCVAAGGRLEGHWQPHPGGQLMAEPFGAQVPLCKT